MNTKGLAAGQLLYKLIHRELCKNKSHTDSI
jgi:hypothetical protein